MSRRKRKVIHSVLNFSVAPSHDFRILSTRSAHVFSKHFKNRNMDLIFSFPGGESCRGFFIVSLLVEMAAASGITVSAGCCYSSYFLFFMLTLSEPQSDAVCPSVPFLFLCPNHTLWGHRGLWR